jgi:putative FmdB family regulatory protein
MPTYEYECLECKQRFEVFQSMNDAPITKCSKCGKSVRKIFNSAGLIFKGSGFYVNDYKSKNDKQAASEIPAQCQGCSGCSMGTHE